MATTPPSVTPTLEPSSTVFATWTPTWTRGGGWNGNRTWGDGGAGRGGQNSQDRRGNSNGSVYLYAIMGALAGLIVVSVIVVLYSRRHRRRTTAHFLAVDDNTPKTKPALWEAWLGKDRQNRLDASSWANAKPISASLEKTSPTRSDEDTPGALVPTHLPDTHYHRGARYSSIFNISKLPVSSHRYSSRRTSVSGSFTSSLMSESTLDSSLSLSTLSSKAANTSTGTISVLVAMPAIPPLQGNMKMPEVEFGSTVVEVVDPKAGGKRGA
ncbi:hypothetical protein PM082_024178 [Marasmius tenuissimus]|nr:hypothetical protein PM082_024178 [Marasmius tenuissimus]